MRLKEARIQTCTFLLVCYLTLRLATSLQCLSQSLEDVVIDIQSSLSRGIRGTEPTRTPTPQDCMDLCCSTRNISGDKACNLMIFDARKTTNQPNCYLFYCPSEDACPLKPAKGLQSYRIIKESLSSPPGTELSSPGQWNRVTLSPPTLTGSLKPTDVFGGNVWSQQPVSSGHLEKLLKIGPASPWFPGPEGEAGSPSSHFSSEQKKVPLGPENGTVFSTPVATAILRPAHSATRQSMAPGTPSVASPPETTAAVTTAPARHPTGLPATVGIGTVTSLPVSPMATMEAMGTGTTATLTASSQATTGLRGAPQTVPFLEASSLTPKRGATHKAMTLPLSSLDSASVNKTSSQESGHRLDAASLSNIPDRHDDLPFEKWLLLGSLVFGVLFLAIGLILMGRMFLESLHRKRYSRLDYLINGIYVDI